MSQTLINLDIDSVILKYMLSLKTCHGVRVCLVLQKSLLSHTILQLIK